MKEDGGRPSAVTASSVAASSVAAPPAGKDELLREITEALYRFHNEKCCPVIVIDEAQMITGREIFDEIIYHLHYHWSHTD